MRYEGSGIKGVGSEITTPGSGIASRGIGISNFFEGSGIRLKHFCGIKDQNLSRFWNFEYKNGISDEKT